ncbi:MAG: putative sulfate exporter family transporter [Candidatus Aminicenantes bacterium]|nr:putative sulfate exporter family transporter [Candidatus Aminicenantes bacterium]MDH5744060.1 putative sulfate exporter family transporter [Candidatus Aminicenantes bacterium]
MKKEYLPGWALMFVVGTAAMFLSNLVVVGGKNPIEAAVTAILLGILIRNSGILPSLFLPGIKAFEKILILGIVLIGASLNFRDIASQGPNMLAIILVTMTISFFVIYFLGKIFNLPTSLAVLLSVGTTICGGSAIAVTAPLIKAKEEETSYAIGTIALWGLVAIIFYPKIAQMLAVSDINFGVFAGTAIHSTPQVVGAGFIFSDLAGKTATAVKLVRNCFMAPLAFLIAVWYANSVLRSRRKEGTSVNVAKAFPWFLFGYFLMAGLNTQGYFSPEGVKAFNTVGRFLILLGLAGIGLNTAFSSFKKVGLKPLVVGFIGALVVAGCSILMIHLLF